MNREVPLDPMPGTERLCGDGKTVFIDLVVRHYPPGAPAPPLILPPHLRRPNTSSATSEDSPPSAPSD